MKKSLIIVLAIAGLVAILFFWGIGLVAHGLSVFVPQFVLGKDWEERKIRELMEKNK